MCVRACTRTCLVEAESASACDRHRTTYTRFYVGFLCGAVFMQAQKAKYEKIKSKAVSLHETAKRARREARMYKLKKRMLEDQLSLA